jgi:tetratricopeptide (TPR) repeat protein
MKLQLTGVLVLSLAVMFGSFCTAQTLDEGTALFTQNKLDEAAAVFENCAKIYPNQAEPHFYLGQIYLKRENPHRNVEEAMRQFEKALELDSKNARCELLYAAAIEERARTAGFLKRPFLVPKIKKALLRTIELDPKLFEAHVGLAQFYLRAPCILGGDEEKGLKQLDEAVVLDPFRGRLVKARMLDESKKTDDARREYAELAASAPGEWRAWKSYGSFSLRHDSTAQAVECYRHYVDLRPDTADSYRTLADAFIKQGAVDRALPLLKKSLGIDSSFVPALLSMGDAYKAKGQIQEAKGEYERALRFAHSDWQKKRAEQKLKDL